MPVGAENQPDFTAPLSTLNNLTAAITAGGHGLSQAQVDSITNAIAGTTAPRMATFAVTLGMHASGDLIGYSLSVGFKRYQNAVAAMPDVFDHTSGKTMHFTEAIKSRTNEMGWGEAQGDIITNNGANGNPRNVLTEYVQFKIQDTVSGQKYVCRKKS